jgi:pimeloyl-ACP methyl ester carboxylesterase
VRRAPALVASAVVAVVLAVSGCTQSATPAPPPTPQAGSSIAPTPSLARYYAQRPAWQVCGAPFECASIDVPLDYADPTSATLRLNLIRLPAADPAHRIGSLVVNPGGPGASGISFARAAMQVFTPEVRAVYDIIGFDPRGVGSSDPVHCATARQLDQFFAYDGAPTTPAQEQGLAAVDKQFVDGCARDSGGLLEHVGTVDAARDMDVIRAAVGDARLDYYGASYGTFLGATYAELFPSKVGRLVLDGAIDPTLGPTQLNDGQLGGFDIAMNAFLADCVSRAGCPVGPTVAQARAQITQLVDSAQAHPLPSHSGRPLTESLVVLGLITPLYSKIGGWPTLRVALRGALAGNGTGLLSLADSYTNRNPDGTYASNELEANYAVNCVDRADHSTLAQTRATATGLAAQSPMFGRYFAWGNLPCTMWPVPATDTPHAIHAAGAAPILVVGTTRDPATPYQWAVHLAAQLDSGRLLTRVGDGHTAYTSGSRCIDDDVDAYLLRGTLPPAGTVCQT